MGSRISAFSWCVEAVVAGVGSPGFAQAVAQHAKSSEVLTFHLLTGVRLLSFEQSIVGNLLIDASPGAVSRKCVVDARDPPTRKTLAT